MMYRVVCIRVQIYILDWDLRQLTSAYSAWVTSYKHFKQLQGKIKNPDLP